MGMGKECVNREARRLEIELDAILALALILILILIMILVLILPVPSVTTTYLALPWPSTWSVRSIRAVGALDGHLARTEARGQTSAALTRAYRDTLPLLPICYSPEASHSANGDTKHVVTGRVIGPSVGLGEGRKKGAGRFRSSEE